MTPEGVFSSFYIQGLPLASSPFRLLRRLIHSFIHASPYTLQIRVKGAVSIIWDTQAAIVARVLCQSTFQPDAAPGGGPADAAVLAWAFCQPSDSSPWWGSPTISGGLL